MDLLIDTKASTWRLDNVAHYVSRLACLAYIAPQQILLIKEGLSEYFHQHRTL